MSTHRSRLFEKLRSISFTLSGDHLDSIAHAFSVFDKDGDGKLSFQDLSSALNSIAGEALCKEFESLLVKFDGDKDGLIDLDEFIRLSEIAFFSGADPEDEIINVFNLFDKDKNGFISAKELQEFHFAIGYYYSIEECGKMIRPFDVNGDGQIDLKEFKTLMSANNTLLSKKKKAKNVA